MKTTFQDSQQLFKLQVWHSTFIAGDKFKSRWRLKVKSCTSAINSRVSKGPVLCAFCFCWCCKMHALLSVTLVVEMAVTCLQLQQRGTLGSNFFLWSVSKWQLFLTPRATTMRQMRNLGPSANDACPKSLASYNDFLYTFSYIGIWTSLLR